MYKLLFNKIEPPSIVVLKYPLENAERNELVYELKRSRFQTPQVFEYLAQPELYKYVYSANGAGATLQLNIISPAESVEPALIRKILRRAAALLTFTDAKKPLKVIWVPCNARRTMPPPGEMITADHINGGYTYMNGDTIYIYRYEEFAKVLLHEILHHTYFDLGQAAWPLQELRAVFNIAPETSLMPNEAVIETWAEVFQMIFLSIETEIPLETLIEVEATHALCQSAKLLAHKPSPSSPWREDTNAFSYIVFRAIFMCNLPEFIMANRDIGVYTRILIDGWKSAHFQDLLANARPTGCDLRMSAFNNF